MSQAEARPLAALIRRFRLSAGLSQEELAERSGLSARAISDLERGLRLTPRPETIRMLAEGMGLTGDERVLLITAARPELAAAPGDDSNDATARFGHRLVDLPDSPGELIGRDSDVANLVSRLVQGDARLITLTGPGGVGKTRLALDVAHRVSSAFPGGAVFVDLAPVSNSNQVASAIAQALKIPETGDRSPEQALRDVLALRPPMLLLLDNFEQVIEAAPLVRSLLEAAPGLVTLVTSRETLRVRGEVEFHTEPLEVPPAETIRDLELVAENPSVALFVQCARKAEPRFVLTDGDAAPVVEICRRLDGLPLAIELAATRIRHVPPDVLLLHLEPRLPLLTGGARDLPARQQTMSNTIAWSYDLLAADEQALLRQLGVFVGGASLDAVKVVVSDVFDRETHVLAALSTLVDKHLVRMCADQGGSPRFCMLEVVREFAIEQLHQAREYQSARHAHAEYFLDAVQTHGVNWATHLHGFPGQELIAIEIDNIRSAIGWFDECRDAESMARIVDSIWAHHYVSGHFRESRILGERILVLARDQPLSDALRVSMLGTLSTMTSVLGDSERAIAYARQSLELVKPLPSGTGLLPLTLIALTIALRDNHQFIEAMEYAEQALPAARDPGVDPFVEPHVLYHIGRLAYLQGDLARAETCLSESLVQIRRLGPTETALYTVNTLAEVHLKQGNLPQAAGLLREGRLLLLQGGYTGMWFDAVVLLAAKCGLPDHAARMLGSYSAYYTSLGISDAYVDPSLDSEIGSLRDQVGALHFEAEFRAGTSLTMGEAMEIALQVLDRAEADLPV